VGEKEDCIRGASAALTPDYFGAAQPKWLRTATRRYRPNNSNQKPLERTQNWIKLGVKVTL
jgi:hypothetical protein